MPGLEQVADNHVLLRVSVTRSSHDALEALQVVLGSHPDIESVEIDEIAGSILIRGRDARALGGAVADLLEALENAARQRTMPSVVDRVALVRSLDRWIRALTRGRLSI